MMAAGHPEGAGGVVAAGRETAVDKGDEKCRGHRQRAKLSRCLTTSNVAL